MEKKQVVVTEGNPLILAAGGTYGDGSVADVYVVNEYMLDADTDIVDYGEYSSVENLSSEEEIIKKGE